MINRRDFLKTGSITGLGMLSAGWRGLNHDHPVGRDRGEQVFNMRGYAAPALDQVRVAVFGIGSRGMGALRRLHRIEGVDIRAIVDLDAERLQLAQELLAETPHQPQSYEGPEEWKQVCEREDIDLVYICTPWSLHTPQAVGAMESDKHAAVEIPAAQTLEECWQLVETSERTRKHCFMLENVCYDFFEMMTLKMVREGFFGDIIHGEGAYIHDRLDRIFNKELTTWRLHENIGRHGSLYPMHGLGPIAKAMNLNAGDRMNTLVSISGNDFSMGPRADALAENDSFWTPYSGRDFRGNMNVTAIRTEQGRTIMLQHDTSSPRPYSRIHLISGTEGIARKYPLPARIATSHDGWLSEGEFAELEEQYTPEITRRVGEMARQVGGHGGMDTLMDWRLIDCLRNGLPLDMDVYDAALWSSVIPLSEWSVAQRSQPAEVPDFTRGAWRENGNGMDIDLQQAGGTQILS